MGKGKSSRTIADNRQAFFNYFIEEKYEAGIVLTGTEIKSIRLGKVNLKEGYARVKNGEVWLYNVHISPYELGNRYNHEPLRERKLLLNKGEIDRLIGITQEQGLSLIPINMHWSNGWAKVELGVARGKKLYDKRDSLKKKAQNREIERAIKNYS